MFCLSTVSLRGRNTIRFSMSSELLPRKAWCREIRLGPASPPSLRTNRSLDTVGARRVSARISSPVRFPRPAPHGPSKMESCSELSSRGQGRSPVAGAGQSHGRLHHGGAGLLRLPRSRAKGPLPGKADCAVCGPKIFTPEKKWSGADLLGSTRFQRTSHICPARMIRLSPR